MSDGDLTLNDLAAHLELYHHRTAFSFASFTTLANTHEHMHQEGDVPHAHEHAFPLRENTSAWPLSAAQVMHLRRIVCALTGTVEALEEGAEWHEADGPLRDLVEDAREWGDLQELRRTLIAASDLWRVMTLKEA